MGFGSIMIEQDLMEARHGKEQWKGTNVMDWTGDEIPKGKFENCFFS